MRNTASLLSVTASSAALKVLRGLFEGLSCNAAKRHYGGYSVEIYENSDEK